MNKNNTKLKVNFIIDVLLFILLVLISAIGLLMKYVLLSGVESWAKYHNKVDLLLFGWDRHQWGTFHLLLAAVFVFLLVLHVYLHWTQIKCMFRKTVSGKNKRMVLTAVLVFLSVLILILPFLLPIEIVEVEPGRGRQHLQTTEQAPPAVKPQTEPVVPEPEELIKRKNQDDQARQHDHQYDIRGSMTLSQVARQYHIPADTLKSYLGIDKSISSHTRLGRLRRQYNFQMSTIEHFIQQWHQKR